MEKGRSGEDAAVRFLRRRGWLPLVRNWTVPTGGELDIVAIRDGVLAVIEVKSRRSAQELHEPVSLAQRARLGRGAAAFLHRNPQLSRLCVRFDLILVARSRRPPRITHQKGAFDPPVRRDETNGTGPRPDLGHRRVDARGPR